MTAPISVGQVSVEVVADTRKLAKSLKREIEGAFKGVDFKSVLQKAINGEKLTVTVTPVLDTSRLKEQLGKARMKVPAEPSGGQPAPRRLGAEVFGAEAGEAAEGSEAGTGHGPGRRRPGLRRVSA